MINHVHVADKVAEFFGCQNRHDLPIAFESVTNIFAAHGVDVRDIVDKLLRNLFPEELSAAAATGLIDAATLTDDLIASCYRELRDAAASGDEATYQRTMARLRRLQEAEAERIRSFTTDKVLDHAHVDDAMRRADELLARYESPAR